MSTHQVQLLFVDLALILLLARGLGRLAAYAGQPPVVGEILGGILLGPTLLGTAVTDALFPPGVRNLLTGMADLGVALFMFTVGLEIERNSLRGRGRVTTSTALGSMTLPFVLGIGMAAFLMSSHHNGRPVAFTIFIGLSVSVTAFPVLARILADRGLGRTALGGIALATAATVDVLAWSGLAGVQAVVGGGAEHWRMFLAIPYLLVMGLIVRPLLRRTMASGTRAGALSPQSAVVVLIGTLLSAAATEAMGMHFIFGAFLFGLVMPKDGSRTLQVAVVEHVGRITALLLPVYFVVAGLQVDLRGFGVAQAGQLGVIMLVAMVGKFGGSYLGARAQHLPARASAALAALMNTRGLTELVILGVGLQLGLLDDALYSLMVVMAVLTTAMTGPLLSWIYAKPVEVPQTARAGDTLPVKVPSG